MNTFRVLVVALWMGVGVFSASAQSENLPTEQLPLERDTPVFETLTEVAFFDLWVFYAAEGERYQLSMIGGNGLAPLIGVRGSSGDVFAASNLLPDGSQLEAEPDTEAILTLVAPSTGELVVIATRANGQDGTTTGSYRLMLTQLESVALPDPYLDTSFRCRSELAESIAHIAFGDTGEVGDVLRLTVWASFRPVIRVGEGQPIEGELQCVLPDSPEDAPLHGTITGTSIALGALSFAAETPDVLSQTAMFEIPVEVASGAVGLTIGSLDGLEGVFVARIEGLTLEIAKDEDRVTLRHGPLAANEILRLIAVPVGDSRLDMQIGISETIDGVTVCEDWGLRVCELDDWRTADIAYNSDILRFDVLDAIVEVATGKPDSVVLSVFGGNPNATGNYTLWLIGGTFSQLP